MPLALSSVADVELPYLGQWLPAPQPGEDERCLLANTDASQTELELAAVSARGGSIELALAAALADILITAAVDSGCSGSLTWNAKWLVNVRPCSEKFRAADGTIARATCIGDMPVVPRDEAGRPVRITFRNVRCVPAFKFTLLSVTQLWEEQRIDARFADVRSLVLPAAAGGRRIPFTPGGRLPTLTVVSDLPSRSESSSVSGHPASASPPASPPPANELPAEQALPAELLLQVLAALAADDAPAAAALAADEPARALGFHRVGATAHIGRLSAPQAAEILHRRSHLGVDKLRALAHTTVDAPKVLASATATARTTSCTSCAAARIRRGAHSGTLSAPAPEPGVLHIDLKELVLSIGGYRYVAFAIDEHARYAFVQFLKHKSEVVEASKRIVAEFEALVGTPIDEEGRALPRPRVREIHSDREGGLMSAHFREFRAEAVIHHTTSPPHDHDLNPIAERIIGLISETAAAIKEATDAPARLWPWLISYVVDWYNSTITSVGSSTADANITPHQRFTLRPPRVMDLAAFGARAVVLKPPTKQHKPSLSARGWVGAFLGRSRHSKGSYDVLVGNSVVSSSSVVVDEEHFDWAPPAKRHQPLTPLVRAAAQPQRQPLVPGEPPNDSAAPPPSTPGRFLNLFSGPYARADGLAAKLRGRGWESIDQIDNDGERGGGWQHDLLNDSTYAKVLADARAGVYAAMMIAFPCSTGSVARLFDASAGGADRGPPPVRSRDHPDGLPEGQLDLKHVKELRAANQLLARVAAIAVEARRSPARTTIIFEQPADRSVESSTAYSPELAAHGSILATTTFKRLAADAGLTGSATFAYCRLVPPPAQQKYTTLYYTPEAAAALDVLNGPDYQCNHERGTHAPTVGGRDSTGSFTSARAAAYPEKLNDLLAEAFTLARTGGQRVPRLAPPTPATADIGARAGNWRGEPSPPLAVESPLPHAEPPLAGIHAGGAPPPPSAVHAPHFAAAPPAAPGSSSPAAPRTPQASPVAFPSLTPSPAAGHTSFQPIVPPSAPRQLPRAVRSSPSWNLAGSQLPGELPPRRAGSRAAAASRFNLPTVEEGPPTPSGTEQLSPPQQQYTPGGTADSPSAYDPGLALPPMDAATARTMEAAVASALLQAAADAPSPFDVSDSEILPLTAWVAAGSLPRKARQRSARLPGGGIGVPIDVLLADGEELTPELITSLSAALRADSPGAPGTHQQAVAAGEIWMRAEGKELDNHRRNESWKTIRRSKVPPGRRIHKLIWVYKLKRDGTAKARLCVQGNTLQSGVDYDQVWSSALRYSSARALFAYAARKGCRVRSVDLVAAYLQGKFIDGEVVYCYLPPGYVEYDADGQPMVAQIEKPIYGIQQAGRRLQRMLFTWLKAQGFEQLDDSDPCVFTRVHADGEILTIGVYVDNLQIVHSAELDASGRGPKGCAYNTFMDELQHEWEVTDEGPMEDLLGIEIDYLPNGAIKLHQTSYIKKIVARFLPDGPSPKAQRGSLPYSANLLQHVADALSLPAGSYPELVKPMQERVGCLMYAATSTRPDIAFVVNYLCRCLQRPTPELIAETDHVFSYLARHASAGLTYTREEARLAGYSDASWEVKHSTSGWLVLWQSAALSWGSKQQKSIALSSCEAEIIALSEAAKDVVYLRKLVGGLGEREAGATPLATDSQSARDTSYNPEHHDRMKHVQRRHFFVRDMVESLEIEVPFVRTADNIADFFTKPFTANKFHAMRKIIMNEH